MTLGPELVLAESISSDAEVLIVGLTPGDDGPTVAGDAPAAEAITAAVRALGAKGKPDEVTKIPAPDGIGVASVVAVGLGADPSAEQIRKSAGSAVRALNGTSVAATTLSALDLAAAAEGAYLGAYRFTEFKAKSAPTEPPLRRVELLGADDAAALQRSAAIAEAVATARTFVNTPPSHLFPAEFASRAQALGEAAGLTVEVLDETALEAGGYGGILGVGKGSSRLPRLVRLSYTGGGPKVALVGKGITFDTGGISIKPAQNMENMTSDMGGAAAVVASVVAAAKLGLQLDVTATVPMAENMPSGTAQRPGDVLTQYGGTTVEVINTDAEGRLILADAIVRACEESPAYLIDTATLTGAQMVALGTRTPGVMGTDEFRDRVARISQQVGENAWSMPLPEELRADLDSRVADLSNVTPHRWGGMLSAGRFLKEFVADGVQWAHIDIAGPAYNTGSAWGYTTKGGTGVPVRTILAVLEDIVVNG